MTINRRQFLRGALGLSGAAVIGADLLNRNTALAVDTVWGAGVDTSAAAAALPHPAASGIDHVVVVMMENRSFDHFLGWLPNADGIQSGLAYADPSGGSQYQPDASPQYGPNVGTLTPVTEQAGTDHGAGTCVLANGSQP